MLSDKYWTNTTKLFNTIYNLLASAFYIIIDIIFNICDCISNYDTTNVFNKYYYIMFSKCFGLFFIFYYINTNHIFFSVLWL